MTEMHHLKRQGKSKGNLHPQPGNSARHYHFKLRNLRIHCLRKLLDCIHYVCGIETQLRRFRTAYATVTLHVRYKAVNLDQRLSSLSVFDFLISANFKSMLKNKKPCSLLRYRMLRLCMIPPASTAPKPTRLRTVSPTA